MLCVSFNSCCASLTPPFLPIVESISISLLVAFLNEPKIIFIPSENVELIGKSRDRAERIATRLCPGPLAVIIYALLLFLRSRLRPPRPSRAIVVGSGTCAI